MGAEFPQNSPKPICAVVDTSVWRAQPLLKTPLGVTLVYTLSRRGGVLGLPEVVESELKGQIVEAGLEAAEKARRHLHMLRTLTDNRFFATEPPTAEKLRQTVEERIAQLGPVLAREPFTVEHAKAALAMVNAKVPPSDKNQQFKDCAIWQAVLALAIRYSTVLITHDKGFFRNRNPEEGLAENLVEDCTKAGIDVKGFDRIAPYLKALEADEPEFDRNSAKELIIPVAMQRVRFEAERCKTVPTAPLDFNISAFPTENPDRLAIDYSFTFKLDCSPEYGAALGIPDRGIVHGSAYFLPKDNNLTDHYIQGIVLKGRGSRSIRSFKDYDRAFAFPRPLSWD